MNAEHTLQPVEEYEIDLRDILRVIQKRRWVIAVIALAAVLTSGVLSFFVLPPVYETKSTLLVVNAASANQRVSRDESGLEGVFATLSRIPEMTVNTYVGQLTSYAILKKTAEELKLDPAEYSPVQLSKMVSAKGIKDTNLIELTVQNTDPQLATDIANTLSKVFLNYLSENNQEMLGKSVQFMEKQFENLDKDLAQALKRLTDFQAQPRGVSFLEQELKSKVDDALKYRAELVQAQVQRDLLAAGLASAEESLAKTEREIVVEVPATDAGPEGQGEPLTKRVVNPAWVELSNLANQKRVALSEQEARIAALKRLADDLDKEVKGLQAELVRKRAEEDKLKADVERLSSTRSLLATKVTETRIARSIDLGQTSIVVVSPAMRPAKPVKPKKSLNMAAALILGLMTGVAMAFLLERLDNTVKTAEDVENLLDLPVLGSIPDLARVSSGAR